MKELVNPDNSKHIEAWIKSTQQRFYEIDYFWKKRNTPKRGKFNPDFFIKMHNLILIVEIKDDEEINDPSPENKKKNDYALAHFKRINTYLQKKNTGLSYKFNFLTPSNFNGYFQSIRDGKVADFRSALDVELAPRKSDLFFSDIIPDEDMAKKDKYSSHLPVYSLQAVATAFSEEQKPELLGWKKIDARKKLDKHMFVAQVVGRSMEPTISDGSYCIFRFDQGGSRNGKVVLVESRQVTDPETNQKFTVKRYHSEKEKLEGDQWRHKEIVLSSDNKEFKDIILEDLSGDDFHVVAEFIELL